jgi:protein required for attachment to host cells
LGTEDEEFEATLRKSEATEINVTDGAEDLGEFRASTVKTRVNGRSKEIEKLEDHLTSKEDDQRRRQEEHRRREDEEQRREEEELRRREVRMRTFEEMVIVGDK